MGSQYSSTREKIGEKEKMSFGRGFPINTTYNSGLGNEMSAISPKGMKASCSVWAVTWLSSPPTKRVAFSRVWSDMVSFLLCVLDLIRLQ